MRKMLPAAPLTAPLLFATPLLLAASLAVPGAAVAQGMDSVRIRVVPVAPGVHMLMGSGGNIGVSSGPDGVFVIDDEFAPLTDRIVAAIRTFSDGPIRFLVNTHWHGDHTGGNANFAGRGVVIFAQDNVRERLKLPRPGRDGQPAPAPPAAALPVVTFADAITFHMNDDSVYVFHVPPAHTDGDAVIHFTHANAVHMGDTFFNGHYPYVDLQSGGSIEGIIAAADTVLKLADEGTAIIPGHGELGDRASLQAYRDVVKTVRDRVAALIEQGKTLAEIQAAAPSKEFDAKWGWDFIPPARFVEEIYRSLAPESR